MTAVMPRPATAPDSRPRRETDPVTYTWVLSVTDWQVHALAEPGALPMGEVLATRCQRWHPIGCPVNVARRSEICARCMAGGIARLEVLPDRTAAEQGHPW